MVNHDLRLSMHELVCFAHQVCPEGVPLPPTTVFTPPVPSFDHIMAFCRDVGEVLKMNADVTLGRRSGVDGTNNRKSGVANIWPSSPGIGAARRKGQRYAGRLPIRGNVSGAIAISCTAPLRQSRPFPPLSATVETVAR